MDFYWLTESRDQAYYNVVGGKPDKILPRVYNPECGHTFWVGGRLVLPIGATEIPGIEPYLKRGRKYESITPEEWITLKGLIAEVTRGTVLSEFPVYPGMRCGPIDITYTCRKEIPDYMWVPNGGMFSDLLIQQLGPLNDVIVYPVSAHRKSAKQAVEQAAYFELIPLTTAAFAPICEYRRTECPICGQLQKHSYRFAIVDTTGLDDIDVVNGEDKRVYYSERFKQRVEAAGVRGLTFIPGWRMSSDCDLSEILYDMEFERQTGRPPDISRPDGW